MTNLGFLKAPSVGLLASVPSSGFEELATEGSPPGTEVVASTFPFTSAGKTGYIFFFPRNKFV